MSQLSRTRGVRQFTYCQELERATDDGDHDPDERVVQEDVHVCGVCAGLTAAGLLRLIHASQLGMVQLGGEWGGKEDLRAQIYPTLAQYKHYL